MNFNMTEFKDKLFAAAKAKGFADCELYASQGDSFRVMVFRGEVQDYTNAGNAGVSFRGTYKGKIGYAYSEKMGDDVIDFLIQNAAANAEINEDVDIEKLYPGDAKYDDVKTFSEELDKITADQKIAKALEMEKIAAGLDPRIAGIDYCGTGSGNGYRYIANSSGLSVESRSNGAQGYVMARVQENGQFKTDREVWVGHNWDEFEPAKVAKSAVEKAVAQLGATPVPTGVYDIVLENEDASSLLAVFNGIFSAESVQKGFSLLAGKIGEEIAASHINIRDDALLPLKAGSRSFDDEGVATKNKVVVENGVLRTFLHNTKTAAKDGVAPTGNGNKAGYKASLSISPTNFYIVPSQTKKEELLAEMKDGLLIKDLSGLHAGVNPVSGDFSVICGGFLVEGGKTVRPVEQITIAGNFFAILKNIVKVADDLNQSMSPIASPSLWIKGVNVAGS
ncbi:MAG: TldD/PmbA family protein [Defluviitaleaceae bacterium]|nr:TldD/PmbA family protein [Defluviitaleaceae bacterium]